MKTHPGLIALAVGAFSVGTTEFAPMGLLPLIAEDLNVSIPTAGLLISAFALGVVISAPILALSASRMPRRTLLIAMAGILAIGNLMSAMADDYAMMLVSRVITSLNMGAYFGVGAVVAASLVSRERQASAVAFMFTGLALSNVIGVPLATWAGEKFGWRVPFWGIAALGGAVMITLRATLPDLPGRSSGSAMTEIRALLKPKVLVALSLPALGAAAWFSVFTYVAPILRDATQATPAFAAVMLVTFGIGLTVGNHLGGMFADRSLSKTLITGLVGIAVVQVAHDADPSPVNCLRLIRWRNLHQSPRAIITSERGASLLLQKKPATVVSWNQGHLG